jgi:hypothetical protein
MITQARLKELLHYDPDTGVFTWKVRSAKRIHIGDVAGCVAKRGRRHYRSIKVDGELIGAHRLAWLYSSGSFPANHIDHIDGNGLNNSLSNLRDVTLTENLRNSRLSSNNKSGFNGVHFDETAGKWRATIRVCSVIKYLGYFTDINDAIDARKSADIEHGYHQNHGQIRTH